MAESSKSGVICGCFPYWGLRQACGELLETVQCLFHVSWHGDVDCAMGVIPCQGHPEVERSAPVGGDDVELLKSGEEINGIVFVCVFDAEIINHEAYVISRVVWDHRPGVWVQGA
jgi:hypothetical protein